MKIFAFNKITKKLKKIFSRKLYTFFVLLVGIHLAILLIFCFNLINQTLFYFSPFKDSLIVKVRFKSIDVKDNIENTSELNKLNLELNNFVRLVLEKYNYYAFQKKSSTEIIIGYQNINEDEFKNFITSVIETYNSQNLNLSSYISIELNTGNVSLDRIIQGIVYFIVIAYIVNSIALLFNIFKTKELLNLYNILTVLTPTGLSYLSIIFFGILAINFLSNFYLINVEEIVFYFAISFLILNVKMFNMIPNLITRINNNTVNNKLKHIIYTETKNIAVISFKNDFLLLSIIFLLFLVILPNKFALHILLVLFSYINVTMTTLYNYFANKIYSYLKTSLMSKCIAKRSKKTK
ncbi:MAG: hypothetical protein NZZ41_03420 [Candidatus Dojkabacteria bacterium]|nr:hypothetical protein [Candidatus Dojkabacteria bacterium]